MSYSFPYRQNCDQTMMISSPSKLPHSILTSYADCGTNSYKSMLMYSPWQWPPTPEGLPPPLRLPHINRYSNIPPIPSPITPNTSKSLHPVEPLSPVIPPVPTSVMTPNSSPSMQSIPQLQNESVLSSTPTGSKRGRPRADVISSLQYFGSNSTCSIRCHICHRVFPREKSLQAHLRTHTGERPYRCDYPNCTKSFVQSGQLKTHQRLHSGEKPFKCCDADCSVRFTHANRHCPDHPHAKLLRDDKGALEGLLVGTSKQDTAIAEWLDKYVRTRLDRTNAMQQQRPQFKRESTENYPSSDEDITSPQLENVTNKTDELVSTATTPSLSEPRGTSVKRQLLSDDAQPTKMDDQNEPAVRIPLSPKRINQNGQVLKIDPRHPVKKRILAYNQFMKENQEQLKMASSNSRNLQRPYPILPPVNEASPKRKVLCDRKSPEVVPSSIRSILNRPIDGENSLSEKYSFLQDLQSSHDVKSQSGKSSPCIDSLSRQHVASPTKSPLSSRFINGDDEPSERWNGAMALMQLASSPPSRKVSSSSER